MNTIKLTAGLLLVAPVLAQAQFDTQLPLQYGIQQTYGNPASLQDHKVSIALPSVTFGFYTPIALTEMGTVEDGTLHVDADQFINRLDADGNTPESAQTLESFAFNYRGKRWQANVSHRVRAGASLGVPKGLVQLAAYGNAALAGAPVQVAPEVNGTAYQEFALGGAFGISEFITVGARFKYLLGAAAIQTNRASATIFTDADTYNSTITTDVSLSTAGYPVTFTGREVDFGEISGLAGAGTGFALDLGMTFRPSEALEVGLSVRDLGSIAWKGEAKEHVSRGEYTFEGYEGNVFDDEEFAFDFGEVIDTIVSEVAFNSTDATFKTSLPTTAQATVRYRIMPKTTAHATAFAGRYAEWRSGFGIGLSQRVGEWLHVGGLAGVKAGGGYLGANILFDVFGPQIYFACDNVLSAMNVNDANDVFVRAGLNLAFGKVKEMKEVKGWYDTKVEGINK